MHNHGNPLVIFIYWNNKWLLSLLFWFAFQYWFWDPHCNGVLDLKVSHPDLHSLSSSIVRSSPYDELVTKKQNSVWNCDFPFVIILPINLSFNWNTVQQWPILPMTHQMEILFFFVHHQSIISLSFFIFQIFVDSFYMNSRFFVILFALAALSTAEGILSFVEWLSSLWKIFW